MYIYFVDNSSVRSGVHTLAELLARTLGSSFLCVSLNEATRYENVRDSVFLGYELEISHKPLIITRLIFEKIKHLPNDIFIFPNNSTVAYEVSLELKRLLVSNGVYGCVIGIIHSNHEASLSLIGQNSWFLDKVVSVSASIDYELMGNYDVKTERCVLRYPLGRTGVKSGVRLRVDTKLKIIYIGRLVEEQKRFSRVLDLIKILGSTGRKISLDIFGDGHLLEEARAVVHEFDGQKCFSVKVHGWVDNALVLPILKEFDVILLTSEFEGMPVALMEAMSCGVVPIVMDYGPEAVELINPGVNGILVEQGDIQGMARQILSLSDDRIRLNQLSSCALKSSFDFLVPTDWINQVKPREPTPKLSVGKSLTSFSSLTSRVSSLASRLEPFTSTVVWGAGVVGRLIVDELIRLRVPKHYLMIVDGYLYKRMRSYEGIPIFNSKELRHMTFAAVVIASEYYVNEIEVELSTFDLKSNSFVIHKLL